MMTSEKKCDDNGMRLLLLKAKSECEHSERENESIMVREKNKKIKK
jgi:hypothetical protein